MILQAQQTIIQPKIEDNTNQCITHQIRNVENRQHNLHRNNQILTGYPNQSVQISPWEKRMAMQQNIYSSYFRNYYSPYNLNSMDYYSQRVPQHYVPFFTTNSTNSNTMKKQPQYDEYIRKYTFLSKSFSSQSKKQLVQTFDNENNEQSKFFQIKLENSDIQEELLKKSSYKYRGRNQTKNIPKNYGKAMINFIIERSDWIKMKFGAEVHSQLIDELKSRKNRVNSIAHLKQLWTTSKYSGQFRVLSNLFLRKYSFAYIFNSRVSNFNTHIKYKYKIQQALKSPGNFKSIKEY